MTQNETNIVARDASSGNKRREDELKWKNIFLISLLHLVALYAMLFRLKDVKIATILWGAIVGGMGGFGVTAGAHRLWAHRSYKANRPLQIILLICYSIAGQNSVFDWVRDHRVHHKFSETTADPHNANRGFFFAHVGWLMCRKHEDVLSKGAKVDMSDITRDPLLRFHYKYFTPIKILLCFVLPTLVPPLLLKETWTASVLTLVFVRYVLGLNFTWLVNSAAHIWGYKPYDRRIGPVENRTVALLSLGEGWHNYHHVFPWDYKAAELGDYSFNVTTMLLDMFAYLGWAYDLKHPSRELVLRVAARHGDGSVHPVQPPR